jgi:sulfur-carrier protein
VVTTIQVRLFARFRDVAGTDRLEMPASDALTVEGLRRRIGELFPTLAVLLSRSAIAVNGEFAGDPTPVLPSDEVAVIPPVSGG